MYIAPSILSADFANLGAELKNLEQSGADWVHVDVMDGNFVPNLSFGPPVIKAIRPHTKLKFDVHLMVQNPEEYIQDYINAGADMLTVHYEVLGDHPGRTLLAIQDTGVKVGLAIKPDTSPDVIGPLFKYIDLILVMTVEPGFGGQTFMEEQLKKIEILREWIDASEKDILLEVDGGINNDTIALAAKAGADACVAGTSVFKSDNYAQNIANLRQNATLLD